ncbi:MAG: hypothetical protein P8188_12290 [Gemmatimonadota bacterium]|jgi:hypothetical protein
MHKITASLVGAAAVLASFIARRQRRQTIRPMEADALAPAGETYPTRFSLERLRELGL